MASTGSRQATLKELHDVIQDTSAVNARHAVMMMAIRYGAAKALAPCRDLDYELVDRARRRRFAALQRLVYALDSQS